MNPKITSKNNGAIALIVCALAVLSLLVSGCATIARGGGETLVIQSAPSGAEVRLSTGQSGETPFSTEIQRKDGTIFVTVKKNGYKDLNTAVIPSLDGGSLGVGTAVNLLFLPIVNDIVDYSTKANYSHKPNPLMVTLIPVDSNEAYKLVAPPTPVVPAAVPAPVVTPAAAPAVVPTSEVTPVAAPVAPVVLPAPVAPPAAPATPAVVPTPQTPAPKPTC